MDNKKAIDLLNMIKFENAECNLGTWYHGIDGDMKQALEMAIKALEQKPCEDTISRRAVLDYIWNDLGLGDEENGKDLERQMELDESYRYVKSLSSVTPALKMGTQEESESCRGCPNICIMYDLNMKSCKDKTEGVEE